MGDGSDCGGASQSGSRASHDGQLVATGSRFFDGVEGEINPTPRIEFRLGCEVGTRVKLVVVDLVAKER